jgi:bifunctional non-homologous end joining protein LigD
MKAVPGNEKFISKKNFIFEPKLDGYRIICYKNGGEIKLISRNGNDLTNNYPELSDIGRNIKPEKAVLDGEIIVYDSNGLPNFSLLQNHKGDATLIVFDILKKGIKDLTHLPILERKKHLQKAVRDSGRIEKIFYTRDGQKLWNFLKKRAGEGIIAKNISSQYIQGRSAFWIKIKLIKTLDCIILGYVTKKREISSLILGIYSNKKLQYLGNVGTGFSEKKLDELKDLFSKSRPNSPIIDLGMKNIRWILPELVCEVAYLEITPDKKLRAPVFLRLREDKEPRECVLEQELPV